MKCAACSSQDLRLWAAINAYEVHECRGCGHRFVAAEAIFPDAKVDDEHDASRFRTRITNALMTSDEAYYAHLEGGEIVGGHTWTMTKHVLVTASRGGNLRGTTWLDVGCGSGFLVQQLRKIGVHAVGLELGGWGAIAAERKGVPVIQGTLSEYDGAPVDAVSATDVLEHQPEPLRFLADLAQILKPTGRMYLTFPLGDSIRATLAGRRWKMLAPPTHCQFFTHASLHALAERAGLRVAYSTSYNSDALPGLRKTALLRRIANAFVGGAGFGDQGLAVLVPVSPQCSKTSRAGRIQRKIKYIAGIASAKWAKARTGPKVSLGTELCVESIRNPTATYLKLYSWFHNDAPSWLREHRAYFRQNGRGFGEDAFHAMWYWIFNACRPASFLEIGVYRGQTLSLAGLLQRRLAISGVVRGISPFVPAGDSVSKYSDAIDYLSDTRANCARFGVLGPELVKGYSTDPNAVRSIKERSWDCIYIDGNHDYAVVKQDVDNCISALAPDGVIVLDDASRFTTYQPPLFGTAGHIGPSLVAGEMGQHGFVELLRVGHNRAFVRSGSEKAKWLK